MLGKTQWAVSQGLNPCTQCTDSWPREQVGLLWRTHNLTQHEISNQMLIITTNLMSARLAKGSHCDSPVKKRPPNCWQHSCQNTRKLRYFIKPSREEDGRLVNTLGSPLWSTIHYSSSHDRVKKAHHLLQYFQHVIFSPFLGRGTSASMFRDTLWYTLVVVLNAPHIKLLLFSATSETF